MSDAGHNILTGIGSATRIRGEVMPLQVFWAKKDVVDARVRGMADEVLDDAYQNLIISSSLRSLLVEHRHFFQSIFHSIFWLAYSIVVHGVAMDLSFIEEMYRMVGQSWGNFCFQAVEDSRLHGIIAAAPFFYTQSVHHMFVAVSRGHPVTLAPEFRSSVCGAMMRIFTGVEAGEAYLKDRLRRYFPRLPQLDVGERVEPLVTPTSIVPTEDVTTLVELPKRQAPVEQRFETSGLSPLVSRAAMRALGEGQRGRAMRMMRPASEREWTTELPRFCPVRPAGGDRYDPQSETRSLVFRSMRADLGATEHSARLAYQKVEQQQLALFERRRAEHRAVANSAVGRTPPIVTHFCDEVRGLQREGKFAEAPPWRTEAEVAECERVRQWHTVAEVDDTPPPRGRFVRFLPWQLEENPLLLRELGVSPAASSVPAQKSASVPAAGVDAGATDSRLAGGEEVAGGRLMTEPFGPDWRRP